MPIAVYLPGMSGMPDFDSDFVDGSGDRHCHTLRCVRQSAKDMRDNFVVLRGGEYYGYSFTWTLHTTGIVNFSFSYKNSLSGDDIGVSAWVGEIRGVQTPCVRVIDGQAPEPVQEAARPPMFKVSDPRRQARAVCRILDMVTNAKSEPSLRRDLYAMQGLSKTDLGLPKHKAHFDPAVHVPPIVAWAENFIEEHPEEVKEYRAERERYKEWRRARAAERERQNAQEKHPQGE